MLSCFPFSYQQLQEDPDYSHLFVGQPAAGADQQENNKDDPTTPADQVVVELVDHSVEPNHLVEPDHHFVKAGHHPSSDSVQRSFRKSADSSSPAITPQRPVSLPTTATTIEKTKLEKASRSLRFAFSGRTGSNKKGTEHLDEALRKSTESANAVPTGQRYIQLPKSSACRQSPQPKPTSNHVTSPSSSSASKPALPKPSTSPLCPASSSRKAGAATTTCISGLAVPPPRPTTRHPGMDSATGTSQRSRAESALSNNGATDHSGTDEVWPRRDQGKSGSGGVGGGNSSSFIEKPPRGWLHPDQQIAESGINYRVRYVGSLEINTSMRSLDFETRSRIAKECICRVCEESGLGKKSPRLRPEKRAIVRMLADKPNLAHAKSDVNLTITSSFLNLREVSSGEVIAKHEMPNISFASGGEDETLDFVAYVAKGQHNSRACYVLECASPSLAQDVITTIGQAFELRFKEFLKRGAPRNLSEQRLDQQFSSSANLPQQPQPQQPMNGGGKVACGVSRGPEAGGAMGGDPDREYYNDLPGKLPPELPSSSLASSSSSSPTTSANSTSCSSAAITGSTGLSLQNSLARPRAAPRSASSRKHPEINLLTTVASSASSASSSDYSSNLIDLNTDIAPTYDSAVAETTTFMQLTPRNSASEPDYVNCSTDSPARVTVASATTKDEPSSHYSVKDPFDMQPFESAFDAEANGCEGGPSDAHSVANSASSGATVMRDLKDEVWFHGSISRQESESLVVNDGDFLVRASQGSAKQYVLTGMQSGVKKHLLLVDPEGIVRTKDKTFDSVGHLINYHRDNGLPIISAESALILRSPVKVKLKS